MIIEVLISCILIFALFINMYFTYLLNRKMKALREYTKKLPDLVSYVQKTMDVFGKSLHELKESGGKIQADVSLKIEEAKDLTDDLRTLIQFADQRIKFLEKNISLKKEKKENINKFTQNKSILDLIDRR